MSYLVRTPLVPFFMFCFGLEAEGLLAFQGRRGIVSVVRWNLRPVIFGVDVGPERNCSSDSKETKKRRFDVFVVKRLQRDQNSDSLSPKNHFLSHLGGQRVSFVFCRF